MTSTPAASPWSGLRQAAEAATYPGEWHVWNRGIGWEVHFGPDPSDAYHECDHAQCRSLMDWDSLGKGVFSETMARYLAAANPSAVLRLIEERDRLAEAAKAVVDSEYGLAYGRVGGPDHKPEDFRQYLSGAALDRLRAALRDREGEGTPQ